jgi:hypothetical protein
MTRERLDLALGALAIVALFVLLFVVLPVVP